jgi:hypothetical protein
MWTVHRKKKLQRWCLGCIEDNGFRDYLTCRWVWYQKPGAPNIHQMYKRNDLQHLRHLWPEFCGRDQQNNRQARGYKDSKYGLTLPGFLMSSLPRSSWSGESRPRKGTATKSTARGNRLEYGGGGNLGWRWGIGRVGCEERKQREMNFSINGGPSLKRPHNSRFSPVDQKTPRSVTGAAASAFGYMGRNFVSLARRLVTWAGILYHWRGGNKSPSRFRRCRFRLFFDGMGQLFLHRVWKRGPIVWFPACFP